MISQPSKILASAWILLPLALFANLISIAAFDIVFALIALVFLFQLCTGSVRKEKISVSWCLLGMIFTWILANALGYFNSRPMTSHDWNDLWSLRWVCIFFLSFYFSRQIPSDLLQKIDNFFLGYILFLVCLIVVELQRPATFPLYGFERLHGLYDHPNNFALALLTPWAFLLALVTVPSSEPNPLFFRKNIFSLFILTFVLVWTFTRSAWMGMTAALLLAVILFKNKKLLLTNLALLGGSILLILLNVFNLKDRLLYSFDVSKGTSSSGRLAVWKVNWAIFQDYPIFGSGFFKNWTLAPTYYDKLGITGEEILHHAHNQFLQILVGSGIVGLIAYCGILAYGFLFFFTQYKEQNQPLYKKIAAAGLLILTSYIFGGLTESNLMFHEARDYTLLFLGVCGGLLSAQRARI